MKLNIGWLLAGGALVGGYLLIRGMTPASATPTGSSGTSTADSPSSGPTASSLFAAYTKARADLIAGRGSFADYVAARAAVLHAGGTA
jgi:hypothetical protein